MLGSVYADVVRTTSICSVWCLTSKGGFSLGLEKEVHLMALSPTQSGVGEGLAKTFFAV